MVLGDTAVAVAGQRSLGQDLGGEVEGSQGGAGAEGRGCSSGDSCEGGGESWNTEEEGAERWGATAEETEGSAAEEKEGTDSEGGPKRQRTRGSSDGGEQGSGAGGQGAQRPARGGGRQAGEAAGPSGGDRRHAAMPWGGWAQGDQRPTVLLVGSGDTQDNRPKRQEADMQRGEAGRAGGDGQGQGGGGGGSGRLLGDAVDETSLSVEEESCIRGARRQGADILSSTTEDGEEHTVNTISWRPARRRRWSSS